VSAQPTPFVENRPDYERSVQWARDRANAGDDTLEICGHCGCEVDTDPQPHQPGCPGIGKPRASTVAVLPSLPKIEEREPKAREETARTAPPTMDQGAGNAPVAVSAESRKPSVGELASRSSSTRQRVWDRASIVAAIQRWNDEHGEPPKSTEWVKKQDGRPTMSTVINHFGTWVAAIVAAGFEPRRSGGQPGVAVGAAAPVRSWDRDEVIDAIKRFAARGDDQPPTRRDWMHATDEHPNYAMAVKVFGSWGDAVEAAGFTKPTRGTRRAGARTSLEVATAEERGTRRTVGAGRGPRSSDADASDLAEVRAAALHAVNSIFELLEEVGRAVA
jgi:hypothetical protein